LIIYIESIDITKGIEFYFHLFDVVKMSLSKFNCNYKEALLHVSMNSLP